MFLLSLMEVFLFVGFCFKVKMALCFIQGTSGLQKEKQPEWSFCIQGPGMRKSTCILIQFLVNFVYLRDLERIKGHTNMDNLGLFHLFFFFLNEIYLQQGVQLQASFDLFFIIKRKNCILFEERGSSVSWCCNALLTLILHFSLSA